MFTEGNLYRHVVSTSVFTNEIVLSHSGEVVECEEILEEIDEEGTLISGKVYGFEDLPDEIRNILIK